MITWAGVEYVKAPWGNYYRPEDLETMKHTYKKDGKYIDIRKQPIMPETEELLLHHVWNQHLDRLDLVATLDLKGRRYEAFHSISRKQMLDMLKNSPPSPNNDRTEVLTP